MTSRNGMTQPEVLDSSTDESRPAMGWAIRPKAVLGSHEETELSEDSSGLGILESV